MRATAERLPIGGRGDRRCARCGYGITGRKRPVACPMCRASEWQPTGTAFEVSRHRRG